MTLLSALSGCGPKHMSLGSPEGQYVSLFASERCQRRRLALVRAPLHLMRSVRSQHADRSDGLVARYSLRICYQKLGGYPPAGAARPNFKHVQTSTIESQHRQRFALLSCVVVAIRPENRPRAGRQQLTGFEDFQLTPVL